MKNLIIYIILFCIGWLGVYGLHKTLLVNKNIWLVGKLIHDSENILLGWECQAVYKKETDAIKNCLYKDWFIVQVDINSFIPEMAINAHCIYWPNLENKEEGLKKLKQARNNVQ